MLFSTKLFYQPMFGIIKQGLLLRGVLMWYYLAGFY